MSAANIRLIERAAALQTAHDAEALAALFARDGVFEDVPFDAVAKGHAEMIRFWTDTWAAMPDFTMTLTNMFADDDSGGVEWTMSATQMGAFADQPATGRSFALKAATIAHFSGGKIVRWTDYWSLSSFRRQVGLE